MSKHHFTAKLKNHYGEFSRIGEKPSKENLAVLTPNSGTATPSPATPKTLKCRHVDTCQGIC